MATSPSAARKASGRRRGLKPLVPGDGNADTLAIEILVVDGTEEIRVETAPGGLVLSNGDRWRQPLRREEAWRLAEALDELATRPADG